MKTFTTKTISALLVALTCGSVANAAEYSVTVLGPLDASHHNNYGASINSIGQVVGGSFDLGYNDENHQLYEANPLPFLYSNGTLTDIGLLPLPTTEVPSGFAISINDSGQVVGYDNDLPSHGFLYSSGALTDLGTLPGGDASIAYGINNSGVIVGSASVGIGYNAPSHAFSYSHGAMTDLNTLIAPNTGWTLKAAFGINVLGQIVGVGALTGKSNDHGFLYDNGTVTDLGTLPNGIKSNARAINASGQIVGYSYIENNIFGNYHAFSYSNGVMTDLGSLSSSLSLATSVNDLGVIVGYSEHITSYDPRGLHAWVYRNGLLSDLNDLVSHASISELGEADSINASGQIVGTAHAAAANSTAFILTPLINSAAPAPTGLTATVTAADTITLNWTDVVGAGYFQIFRSETPGTFHHYIGRTVNGATSFADSGLRAGTSHYYLVVSHNSYGDGPKSAEVSATTPSTIPAVPAKVQATPIDQMHIDVSWNASPASTHYVILRSATAAGPYTTIGDVSTASPFHDAQLHAGITYYYRIEAGNDFGLSGPSSIVSATTPDPHVPPLRTLTAISPTKILMTFYRYPTDVSYVIYRGTTPGHHAYVATTSNTAYVDTNLTPGTTYYYVFRGLDGTVQGPSSVDVYETTLLVPGAPSQLTAATVSPAQIDLSWTAAESASSYYIYRATSAGGLHRYVGTSSSTHFTDSHLPPGTTFYYVVVGVNQSGQGAKSNEASATTAALPTVPMNVTASPANASQINVFWTASLGASSYSIFRGTAATGSYHYVGTTTALRFGDKPLASHTQYWYAVFASNSHGQSPYSSVVTATTP